MKESIILQLKQVISRNVNAGLTPEEISDDLQLAGNILDSMAVNNLILALENQFGFIFDDEDLTAEGFASVSSLAKLVQNKLNGSHD